MKADKLRELTGAELDVRLRETETQIWKIRFQGATGQTEGLPKLRSLRRDMARMRTIIREKELSKVHGG
ncbi:MAG: 50S ribosomal protein L29 [Acidobacteria bacterium]|nr:50S ribosomal protein L29 [Acidobacteriota bacterium]